MLWTTFVIAPLLSALSLASAPAPAVDGSGERIGGDWPQWRGPRRDAVSLEPELPALIGQWPAGGPDVLWRVEVGEGYSGIAVSGDELYTMWDEGGKQFLVGCDASSGELAWKTPVGEGFRHPYGNGPRSTPLVDGDTVFAIGTSGRLVAADRHTGEPLWERDLVTELGARLPVYGYASSPLVAGRSLVVETAGEGRAYSAFDKTTGEIRWSSGDDRPAYSSPMRFTLAGTDQIVFWSAAGVHSLALETGEELWSFPWSTNCSVTGDPLGTGTPILVAPDRVFLSSGSGTAVLRVSRTADGFRVDDEWESKVLRNDVNSSVLLGDHVYGFDGSTLKCVDVRTGEAAWTKRGYRKGSLIAAGGRLIVLSEGGELALVDADPATFVERSRARVLDGKSWTSPALAGGRLFLRNHGEMVCVDMRAAER